MVEGKIFFREEDTLGELVGGGGGGGGQPAYHTYYRLIVGYSHFLLVLQKEATSAQI